MNLFTRTAAGLILVTGVATAQPPIDPTTTTTPPAADPARPMTAEPLDPPRVEDPAPAPATRQQPRLLRWADGFLYSDGPATVFRQNGLPGRAANVIRGAGNGVGNSIIVDNGPSSGGVTVIENARNGFGNRVIIDGVDMTANRWFDPPLVAPWAAGRVFADRREAPARRADPAPPARADDVTYPGRENPFWSKKVWSDTYDCNLYFSEPSNRWYRYHRDRDEYRPIPSADTPATPARP